MPGITGAALALLLGFGTPLGANADEKDARRLVKAMSDYLAAQKAISFAYDATLEVVTAEKQKLALASSGTVTLNRPDKIRAARSGGFADVELTFDGKTMTLLGKNANLYSQLDVPGTIDHLIDELKDTYKRPLPAADLLMANVNDELMPDVVDVKDIGSGVVGGVECDHLAFRNKDVDWQIWIAQGDRPYPCRYVITSTPSGRWAAIQRPDQGLEDRGSGRSGRFRIQELNERHEDGLQGSSGYRRLAEALSNWE